MLWCRAIVDDIGNYAMPEHSVLRSPNELCWAHTVLPTAHTDYLDTSVSDATLLSFLSLLIFSTSEISLKVIFLVACLDLVAILQTVLGNFLQNVLCTFRLCFFQSATWDFISLFSGFLYMIC